MLRRATLRLSGGGALLTSYFTDVEGDGEYFERFVSMSKALFRAPDGRLGLREGTRFVFGGDLFDKGPHDRRLCEDFLALKRDYGDRVTFVVGNRDLQKIKARSLLDERWWGRDPAAIAVPYYFGKNGGRRYDEFLRAEGSAHGEASFMRWHLAHCCGCAGGMDLQRQEIFESRHISALNDDGTRRSYQSITADLQQRVAASGKDLLAFLRDAVPDTDVFAAYRDTGAGSAIGQYMQQAQLAAVHDGMLYVHGSVNRRSAGYVPDVTLEERTYRDDETVPGRFCAEEGADGDTWVDALNDFYRQQIEAVHAQPSFDAAHFAALEASGGIAEGRFPRRGGSALFAYGHARSTQFRSVVVGSFFQQQLRPSLGTASDAGYADLSYADMRTATFLSMGGVGGVMVGHQPVGSPPLVMTQPGFRVVCADNSYCEPGSDRRGAACSEVLYDPESGDIRVHGTRPDGEPFDYVVSEAETTIGRRLHGGWWVRQPLDGGSRYRLARTADRFFTLEEMTAEADDVLAASEAAPLRGEVADEATIGLTRADLRPVRNHEQPAPALKVKRAKDQTAGPTTGGGGCGSHKCGTTTNDATVDH